MSDAARDLLSVFVALELRWIDEGALRTAVERYSASDHSSLGSLLTEQGRLDADQRALLASQVDQLLSQHDQDVGRCLESVLVRSGMLEKLTLVAHLLPEAALASLRAARAADDGDNTTSFPDGASTQLAYEHDPATEPAPRRPRPFSTPRFRPLKWLAKGGMGEVYQASDEELRRVVALKKLRDRFAADADLRNRFLVEAEITGGLEHPGIVPVYGVGSDENGAPYYAMRLIRGRTLRRAIRQFYGVASPPRDTDDPDRFEERPEEQTPPPADPGSRGLEFRRLLSSLVDACRAIGYAHSRGVLHRDIKPSNIMLGKHGETLVVDWGLAKLIGRKPSAEKSSENTIAPAMSQIEQTRAGTAVGTLFYMSREQAIGDHDALREPSDVYSLGATLYELLTGSRAFEGDGRTVLRQVIAGDFPRPREVNRAVPRALEAICLKAMALWPEDRYATAGEMADDLERWLANEPVTAYDESPAQWFGRLVRAHAVERIRDAGIFALVCGAFHIAWGLLGSLFVLVGFMSYFYPNLVGSQFVVAVLYVQAMFFVPMSLFGWHTMRRRAWAMWGGLLVAAYSIAYSLWWGFTNGIPALFSFLAFGGVYADRINRMPLAWLEALVFGCQFVAYALALYAYYANRHALAMIDSRYRPSQPR